MRIVAAAVRTLYWTIDSRGASRGRTERASVLLELIGETEDGRWVGLGEAAPLPGMSIDTLDDAERDLTALCDAVPFDVSEVGDASVLATTTMRSPAARFAVETALFDVLARAGGYTISRLVRSDHPLLDEHRPRGLRNRFEYKYNVRSVPMSAVVDTADDAARALARGVRSLKLKLGADDDLARVAEIAAAAPGVALRIDGNATWRRRDVMDRLTALAQLPIDYVEEPCGATHELLGEAALPCKLALDESLTGLLMSELEPALASPALGAVVLKPTLLGGFGPALALAELARRRGVAAVVSHALEGPIGTAACAELALALGGDVPVGLAPHGGLAGWRLEVPQLATDRVQPANQPGLGFAELDLAGALDACSLGEQ